MRNTIKIVNDYNGSELTFFQREILNTNWLLTLRISNITKQKLTI